LDSEPSFKQVGDDGLSGTKKRWEACLSEGWAGSSRATILFCQ